MNPSIQLKTPTSLFLIVLALACFAFPPSAQAVVPPPDGGYPGGNTAEGTNALLSLTTGQYNTAVGVNSLSSTTTGGWNTAIGAGALRFNTGVENTAVGFQALFNNTTGISNTANGYQALFNNTDGFTNTANGVFALANNRIADNNTATGYGALYRNTGMQNTANGAYALSSNTLGHDNTAIGYIALSSNTTGTFNIGLGVSAGTNLTTGSNNIAIGNYGVAGESNTIRIGQAQTRTFINGISGVAIAGVAVVVNANGQLGVVASSADFKHQIRPMAEESKAILALKPVSFCYDQDIDENGLPQFGLVAEDVEKVNPDLVLRDEEGKPYSVRYDAVNAMLLNEFLKEHRKVQELEATIAQQHKDFEAALSALKGQIQKVSAELELSQPVPRTVNDP
jgi:trimeric autotransporter adhesin